MGRKKRAERYDVRLKFWEGLIAIARNRHTRHANIKPGSYHWLGASSGIRGLGYNYVIVQEYGLAELYIGSIKNAKNIQYTTKFPIGHELRFPDQPHGNLPAV